MRFLGSIRSSIVEPTFKISVNFNNCYEGKRYSVERPSLSVLGRAANVNFGDIYIRSHHTL